MNTSVLKIIMPVAAFMLASAGAIGTSKTGAKDAVAVQGWKRIAPTSCTPVKICNNQSQARCYNGNDQMFERLTPTSDCTGILYHKP